MNPVCSGFMASSIRQRFVFVYSERVSRTESVSVVFGKIKNFCGVILGPHSSWMA